MTTDTPLFRTGAAAERLKVSPDKLRRLIQAGLIEAHRTSGGQMVVPETAIEKALKDGLPVLPARSVEIQPAAQPNPARRRTPAPSPAEPPAPPTSPEVQKAADQVAVTRSRLDRRKTELELEEVEDKFEERETRRQEREEQERRQRAEEQRLQVRRRWEEEQIAEALSDLPYDCDGDSQLAAERTLREALRQFDQNSPRTLIETITAAAVDAGLVKYRQRKETAERQAREAAKLNRHRSIVNDIIRDAVWKLRSATEDEKDEAREIATEALARFQPGADEHDMRKAVEKALKPLQARVEARLANEAKERQFESDKQQILDGLSSWMLFHANQDEREEAIETATEELEEFEPGASYAEMKQAVHEALEPLEAAVREREEDEETERKIVDALRTARERLHHVLYIDHDWDVYGDDREVFKSAAEDMERRCRELLESGNIEPDEVRTWVERWIKNNLWRYEEDGDD